MSTGSRTPPRYKTREPTTPEYALAPSPLDAYRCETLHIAGVKRDVYIRGHGPAVIVLAEVPGITPSVLAFAERVQAAGFTVWLPHLFGTPGAPRSAWRITKTLWNLCISKEFHVLAAGEDSPVATYLRQLATLAHQRCGGKGVGAVGMCITGQLVLSMVLDAPVRAPVLSQPSTPLALTPTLGAALGVSDAAIEAMKTLHETEGVRALGLRFSADLMCPAARFSTLKQALGEALETIEVDSSPGNRGRHHRFAHSVLTEDFNDTDDAPTRQALQRVLEHFHTHLRPEGSA